MAVDAVDLKISVEKPGTWSRRLTITVPAERVERERRSTLQRLSGRVRLPGFRKGKVPPTVMQKRFGPAIEQETLEKVMGEAYREAIQRESLKPISQGSIDRVDYESGKDLTFDVGFDVRPEIELERVGGFRVMREQAPVTDTQVDEVIQRLREQNAVWQPVEGETPLVGDRVVVEITALDDAAGIAGQARSYELILGEGQAVPAIEDVIRTLTPGAEGDFTVELPADPEEAEGGSKPHRIHVALKEVKRPELPAADDSFAQSLGDFASVDVLRDRVRSDLGREAENEAERQLRGQLLGQIIEANPFEVPPSMTDEYVARILPDREGVEAERMEQMRQSTRPAAENAIRRMLIIERIADMESLHATQEDVDARLQAIADSVGRSVAELRQQLHKSGRLHEIEEEITEDRVFDYLKSLSTID
jgi:trigger factor